MTPGYFYPQQRGSLFPGTGAMLGANSVFNLQERLGSDWCRRCLPHFRSESAHDHLCRHVEGFSNVVFPRMGTEGLLWRAEAS